MWGTYDVERLLFWLRLMPAYPVCLILYKNQRLKPEKITSDLYSWCCLCSSVYTSENSKYHTTTDISDMIIYARLYIKNRLVTTKKPCVADVRQNLLCLYVSWLSWWHVGSELDDTVPHRGLNWLMVIQGCRTGRPYFSHAVRLLLVFKPFPYLHTWKKVAWLGDCELAKSQSKLVTDWCIEVGTITRVVTEVAFSTYA